MGRPKFNETDEERRARLNAYSKQWKLRNPDRFRASKRKWARENSEKNRESIKKSREKNKDKINAYKREYLKKWRLKNPDKVKANRKREYERNRDHYSAKSRRYRDRVNPARLVRRLSRRYRDGLIDVDEFIKSVRAVYAGDHSGEAGHSGGKDQSGECSSIHDASTSEHGKGRNGNFKDQK